MNNLKEFTLDQIAEIFKIKDFSKLRTLTDYSFKGVIYQFQFDFNNEKEGDMILNIIKKSNNKIVGFFKY